MTQNDVSLIRVGGHPIGIMGLQKVLEEIAEEFGDRFDDEVGEALLGRLRKFNYITEEARESYKAAFFREYEKLRGRKTEEDPAEGLEVRILGQGCSQCEKMAQEVMAVMSESGIEGDLLHVKDIREIGKYGVMGMPALVINGKVKCAGSVPSRTQMLNWLKEASRGEKRE